MPRVSVIIPCFNQDRFLQDAIASTLDQTFSDLEVIVVNDGSTDHTEAIVKGFAHDPRCRYVYQENHGLSVARNRGIEISMGSYLNFLDADDWLESTKIEEQVHILDDLPEVGFTYCDIIVEYQNGRSGEPYAVCNARKQLSGNIFSSLLMGGYFPPHTILIRRKILDRIGYFDPSLSGCADYDLWLRAAGNGYQAYFLDKKLTHYRFHESNMSSDREHMNSDCLGALRKAARNFPELFAESIKAITEASEEQHQVNRWLDSQRSYWQEEAKRQSALIQSQQRLIDDLEQAKAWLEEQRSNWIKTAHERESIIQQQKQWIIDLEQAKIWLDEQRLHWEKIALEREAIIQQLQQQIADLKQSTTSWEEQYKH